MTKILTAEKCADGYLVKITISIPVGHITDVMNIIRYEGLKMKDQFSNKIEKGKNKGKYTRIFAE